MKAHSKVIQTIGNILIMKRFETVLEHQECDIFIPCLIFSNGRVCLTLQHVIYTRHYLSGLLYQGRVVEPCITYLNSFYYFLCLFCSMEPPVVGKQDSCRERFTAALESFSNPGAVRKVVSPCLRRAMKNLDSPESTNF